MAFESRRLQNEQRLTIVKDGEVITLPLRNARDRINHMGWKEAREEDLIAVASRAPRDVADASTDKTPAPKKRTKAPPKDLGVRLKDDGIPETLRPKGTTKRTPKKRTVETAAMESVKEDEAVDAEIEALFAEAAAKAAAESAEGNGLDVVSA